MSFEPVTFAFGVCKNDSLNANFENADAQLEEARSQFRKISAEFATQPTDANATRLEHAASTLRSKGKLRNAAYDACERHVREASGIEPGDLAVATGLIGLYDVDRQPLREACVRVVRVERHDVFVRIIDLRASRLDRGVTLALRPEQVRTDGPVALTHPRGLVALG